MGEFEFNYNSVPFDYDGNRLLWMDYVDKKTRDVNIYDSQKDERSTVMTLTKKDGQIYFMKLYKSYVFYVKDTRNIMKYDMFTQESELVYKAKDSLVGIHVYSPKLRKFDSQEHERDDTSGDGIPKPGDVNLPKDHSELVEEEKGSNPDLEGSPDVFNDYNLMAVDMKYNIV